MDFKDLDSILPTNWNYQVIARRNCGEHGQNQEVRLKLALFSAKDIKLWIKALEEKTCCNYSIRSTKKSAGMRVLFKQRLLCHHNTKHIETHNRNTRNTNCPSALIITLQTIYEQFKGSPKNAPDPQMPCTITFVITHNHNIVSADALRSRRVTENTKHKLLELYKSGHTPTTALETIKMDIQLSNDNCELQLADRSTCPDYNYCYCLFRKEFAKLNGPIDADKQKTFLIKKLKEYNEQIGEECAMFDIKESAYVITLCPPLCKRIHKNIDLAAEIVFMDATAHEGGSKIYILSIHSQCGGLPLGIIITSSETAENITLGFDMLKTMLGDIIFHHKIGGPKVFMTDDCEAEHIAIKSVWKNSTTFLSSFYVLQAIYRWLVNSKNGIPVAHVKQFFEQFRLIMYATTTAECAENYNTAVNTAQQYPNYVHYLETYWCKRDMWALSYRSFLLIRGNHTNNISEASMRLLQNKLLNRVKAFNVVQLVDFLLTRFVQYYQRNLLGAAQNHSTKDKLLQTIRLPTPDIIEKIQKFNETMYSVPCEKSVDLCYLVYSDVFICTCHPRNIGSICKHIDWVHLIYHSDAYHRRIDNIATREMFLKIANDLETAESDSNNKLDENDHHNLTIIMEESSNAELASISLHTDEQQESACTEGRKIIQGLSEWFNIFLDASPVDVLPALNTILSKRNQIKTVHAFVSACSGFGSEFHQENLESTTNNAENSNDVEGRPHKKSEFKPKLEHNRSSE